MARGSSALQLIRPVAALMPAVRRPDRVVPFNRRVIYTGIAMSVFLVCSHLPLYGVPYTASGADPLYWVRTVLASNRGTLMELGVGPVVTAGTVMQLVTGSKLLRVDQNVRGDRELVDGERKALAMVIALGEAVAHVQLGMYGAIGALGGVLIVLQLVSASVVVVFLDELFDKGYGLPGCSAISLLSATNTCGKVIWHAFSPVTVNTGRGPEFEGVVLAMIHQAVAGAGKAHELVGTMLRRHLPNVMSLLTTFLVLLAAVYLEGVRILQPLQSRDARGRRVTFPIKLLYTSTMPIVLHSAAVSALYMVSQLLHYSRFFGGSVLVRMLGVWKEASHAAVPVGGLVYYVTPPTSFGADPLHTLVYVALLLTSCALLSQAWATASGSSARDVARQLANQRLALPGSRDGATYSVLRRRYIPTAAASEASASELSPSSPT
ncbi:hypothetical protein BS78_K156100 [Paspalum vaginatum]|uniref:Translocon Sec61/SecY plug domain-containing protein n=1 Tax=Paspalum vaginatum TaxID=158149 RepID=A0A9W7X8F7_9POAL|nr:hypothetical protein BS78_K156100 [Paspalum vaginatum]